MNDAVGSAPPKRNHSSRIIVVTAAVDPVASSCKEHPSLAAAQTGKPAGDALCLVKEKN